MEREEGMNGDLDRCNGVIRPGPPYPGSKGGAVRPGAGASRRVASCSGIDPARVNGKALNSICHQQNPLYAA